MRHLRILGLCVAAIFAMSATTLVVASPALAGGCNEQCQKEKQEAKEKKEKEKQEAKEKKEHEKNESKRIKEAEKRERQLDKTGGQYAPFADCPFDTTACVYGEAGKESFFQAGKVTVYFKKPVQLRGGIFENEAEEETWEPALDGDTISREAEPAPPLTDDVDTSLLSPSELARYEEAVASDKTAVTATIELARPEAGGIFINEGDLLLERKEAFGFPVVIHLQNKWLGEHCYVGSREEPIVVPFTTGETHPEPPNTPIHGTKGDRSVNLEGTILYLNHARLVNNEYAAPGVHGCGIDSQADAAIDSGTGLPSPAGSNTTELIGTLEQDGTRVENEHYPNR